MDDFEKSFEKKIEKFAGYMAASENIVFFGGAGVSTESGIPDFRSAGGLYKDKGGADEAPPEVMLSRTYFFENTERFFKFYKTKMLYPDAKPGEAHHVLAKLEEKGKLAAVITQNIDGLHQAAGSKNVVELHGSVKRNSCIGCGKKFELDYIMSCEGIPYCDTCGGIVKPEVTLYEEQLDPGAIDAALHHIAEADMLIVGGTSLLVNPAASFVGRFFYGDKYGGKRSAIINKSETSYDSMFDISFRSGIGGTLSAAYAKL